VSQSKGGEIQTLDLVPNPFGVFFRVSATRLFPLSSTLYLSWFQDAGGQSGVPQLPSVLTIFTVLRDLGDKATRGDQRQLVMILHTMNTVGSWLELPQTEVILFGTPETCQVLKTLEKRHRRKATCQSIPCVHPEYDIPQVDCLFVQAANISETKYLM